MTASPVYDRHTPVLLQEVVANLAPERGGVFIDATYGAGGYTAAILAGGADRVLGVDRDDTAVAEAAPAIAAAGGRLAVVRGRFGEMAEIAAANDASPADGVAFDFGVSSMQLDRAERGFSFQQDGPLDMRMGAEGETAADFVNTAEERDIAGVLKRLGEEPRARRIARKIVERRTEAPLATTSDLADAVVAAVGRRPQDRIHPATRTFQAIRMHVNDELGEIARGLVAAEQTLKPGGRLVVVSFHSLEDRLVKRFLNRRAGKTAGASRHDPAALTAPTAPAASFRLLSRRPTAPSAEEAAANPRARSARLRAAERLDAPAFDPSEDFGSIAA